MKGQAFIAFIQNFYFYSIAFLLPSIPAFVLVEHHRQACPLGYQDGFKTHQTTSDVSHIVQLKKNVSMWDFNLEMGEVIHKAIRFRATYKTQEN